MSAEAPALEVSVTSSTGARTARRCGANRIELCTALELGGLTPSAGLIQHVLDEVGRRAPDDGWDGVHVLLRPRPGDFEYDDAELATLERDVRAAVSAGVDGIVLGALGAGRMPDLRTLERLAGPAREAGLTLTFHRAVDLAADPTAAVRMLAESGLVDRVLTSGGAPSAAEGTAGLAAMVATAAGRLQVMAGAGVNADLVPALVRLGVDAVHLSAKRRAPGPRGALALGTGDDGGHWVTDGDLIRAVVAALPSARGSYATAGSSDGTTRASSRTDRLSNTSSDTAT